MQEIYTSTEQCQFAQGEEPTCFEEAIKYEEWCLAMDEEIKAFEKNKTWELVDLSSGKEVVKLKWTYKLKFLADGSIQKYKARLVA